MKGYKAILFDLDDTLLDRDRAVDKLFFVILETCYKNMGHSLRSDMLNSFKEYDKQAYGYSDKRGVLESLFDKFPPTYRLPRDSIQDFWNNHFPNCFSIDPSVIHIVNTIKKQMKVAIITNGSTQRQKAKITNTHLNSCFHTIFISEEAGFSKPDKRIFDLALNKLDVQPEAVLFVGDDLEKDIGGCQNANIKGIWYNPSLKNNTTKIKPYAEIHSLDSLLDYLT
ncbi:MAG: HAD family hydrolase [Bacillus sp. (in: firmicutes)]